MKVLGVVRMLGVVRVVLDVVRWEREEGEVHG